MLAKRRKSMLGYIPDLPDIRDHHYTPDPSVLKVLPAKVDLTPTFEVYDQGPIGSCTANALAGAIQFDRLKDGERPDFIPSRLFIYYNERTIEGDVKHDSGAMLRDGIKTLHKLGVCPEDEWPYVATPAKEESGEFPPGAPAATKPPARCYQDALKYTITNYQRLHQDLAHLQGCLACGFPFVFGFTVYFSWVNLQNPATVVPLPSGKDMPVGGHAVLCVGYDNATQLFKFRNSWGKSVGENGYFYMPYAYLLDRRLAQDIWTINTVKN
ncbi:C1 family peptidase [Dickeya dadantii subsp. dieffenbachiae]|uniref:C1 family peptidase n=1 Tax=Dickeya dadantii TaxID=204038 RepID=UPI0003A5CE02|nr:C1 family peptidase [Dickeya dadantii]